MDIIFILVAIGLLVALGTWYRRAYLDARIWQEVHIAWGMAKQNDTEVVLEELLKQGVRAKLKTIGPRDLTRLLPQRLASIRVHREDYARASRIIRSISEG